jgi:hypothetical protein
MTKQHPITPPPKLVREWLGAYFGTTLTGEVSTVELALATAAARWGADQQLEADCEWVQGYAECSDSLRATMRPKPPSLKEQALAILDDSSPYLDGTHENIIRRALEQLND